MKAQLKITGMLIGLMVSSSAYAIGPTEEKPATRIDFNKMIDENNDSKDDLSKSVQGQADLQAEHSDESAEQKKVMDFVDLEVGMKADRPVVVDRRFNSIGAPRLASEVELTLIRKQKDSSGS